MTLIAVSPDSRFYSQREINSNLRMILTPKLLHGGPLLSRLTSCQGWGVLDIYKRIVEGLSNRYDIVQTFDHFPNISIPVQYLRKRIDARFVSDWCDLHHLPGGFRDTLKYRLDFIYRKLGFPFRKYLRSSEVDIRKKADSVTVISNQLREVAILYGVSQEKISLIEGGADTDTIKPLPKLSCRKRLNLPLEAKIVVFLGKAQFDLDILIKSFARIKETVPNAYLVVIGKNLYRWTQRLVTDLGVKDNYLEVGYCAERLLPYYLSSADVFALPLKKNLANQVRWPNKIGEYMAAGRPTVISDVGDVARVVRNHEIGLVAEPNEYDLAEKIEILLRDEVLARSLGEKARQIACSKYSWFSLAARLEDIYLQVLDQDGHSMQ